LKLLDIAIEVGDDLLFGQKTIGIVPFIGRAGQADRPIRGDEGKRVPAVIPPDVGGFIRRFEDDVFAPKALEVTAGGKSGLLPFLLFCFDVPDIVSRISTPVLICPVSTPMSHLFSCASKRSIQNRLAASWPIPSRIEKSGS
jgi:hypothetical protein